jgi:hypothetical protein
MEIRAEWRKHMCSKRFLTASAVVVVALAGVLLVRASIPAPNGVIYGCYNNNNGTLSVINNAVATCKSNETQLTWSQTGPQGPIGPQGPQGATGPQGPQGVQGPAGGSSVAGRLQCGGTNCANSTGSTTLDYCPYKGNIKTTASQGNYAIPSACLTATTTSMYVLGVSSSSLSASTLYYIYLWDNSGTWVLDAETTAHATDSTTGIEIMSGDSTKTLVGMIHTDANSKIMTGGQVITAGDINTVATWDNRQPTKTVCSFGNRSPASIATSQTEMSSNNRCYFMSWGDAGQFSSQQLAYSDTAGGGVYTQAWLDTPSGVGSVQISSVNLTADVANTKIFAVAPSVFVPTEGYHFVALSNAVPSGQTVTYPGNLYQQVFSIQ